MNMMFIWKDQKLHVSNVDGLAEMHNDKLKGKKLSLRDKQHILWEHYTSLKDTNKKVICSQDLYNKMNDKQRSYIILCKIRQIQVKCAQEQTLGSTLVLQRQKQPTV